MKQELPSLLLSCELREQPSVSDFSRFLRYAKGRGPILYSKKP